jgi:hypothetical protein
MLPLSKWENQDKSHSRGRELLVQTSLRGPTRVPEGLPSEHASNAGRRPNSFWPSWPLALVSALIVS